MGTSYCTNFLPNSGTVSSAVSVNTLAAHTLLVTHLAMSSIGLIFSEQSVKLGSCDCEPILTGLDVKSNIISCFWRKSKPNITGVISD